MNALNRLSSEPLSHAIIIPSSQMLQELPDTLFLFVIPTYIVRRGHQLGRNEKQGSLLPPAFGSYWSPDIFLLFVEVLGFLITRINGFLSPLILLN